MILGVIVAIAIGLVTGAGVDALLRGRDVASRRVIIAGGAGAIAGLIARQTMGDEGALIGALTTLIGALLVASVTRVRMSATLERESSSAVRSEIGKQPVAAVARVVSDRSVGGDSGSDV